MAQIDAEQYDDDADFDADDRQAAAADAAYEREYQDDHSWELLQEDEHGNLRPLSNLEEQRARRRQLLSAAQTSRIRRGMIRYLLVVVDLSRAAGLTDMRPMRSAVMAGVIQRFIRAFFDENPLSQLGIVVLRNGVAEKLTELSSSPEAHIERLRQSLDSGGDASLQNAVDTCVDCLRSIPPYGHREVLVVLAALSTCDPGNILESVKAAKAAKVRVSVVGLAAEVHVCRTIARDTGGTYGVATGESHLEELVLEHATPPPAAPGSSGVSLVRMGFPARAPQAPGAATFVGPHCALAPGAFACPRCKARTAQLPGECHVCGLTLVASPHLARSYHHLFPVRTFEEVKQENLPTVAGSGNTAAMQDFPPEALQGRQHCYGCLSPFDPGDGRSGTSSAAAGPGPSSVVLQCPDCRRLYCFDCDVYIHEHLHNCPGCDSLPPQYLTECPEDGAEETEAMETDPVM